MTRYESARPSAWGHIDFALHCYELKRCAVCGQPSKAWWNDYKVTPRGRNAIRGLIGVCVECHMFRRYRNNFKVIAKWRENAPTLIDIIPRTPIQLGVRKRCNDKALAQLIRSTLEDKVPARSRKKILDYVLSHEQYTTTGKGMRFEALGQWPGIGHAWGMCMDWGHAIRLRASHVRQSSPEEVVQTIAHELAHTEQRAEERKFDSEDGCERDVEERLRRWGVMADSEYRRNSMVQQLNEVIEAANHIKAKILREKVPSGNFAAAAARQADIAVDHIFNVGEWWAGIGSLQRENR
jgi:hypothetical protein